LSGRKGEIKLTVGGLLASFGLEVDKNSVKSANDAISGIQKTAKRALSAIAVVFSIKGLASLAQAADSADAIESQFASVFGNMESQAQGSLQAIANEIGANANRVKDSFVKMAAFGKASGMETEAALEMSERAIRAVADSAAFFDKTVEDTTSTVQAFLRGNTQVATSLGFVANETTMNAAAMELYGQSFRNLSEEQKQLTRLNMIETANALTGALGQAAREADTWGNQLGNFKQSIKDLKATVGRSFLQPAVQVVMLLSKLIGHLGDGIKALTAEGALLNRMFERMSSRLRRTQEAVDRFVARMGGADRILKLVALAAGAFMSVFAAWKIMGIVASLKALDAELLKAKLKVVAIVAVLVVVALLIEDLINFMNGNDSLIGSLFEKFGVDGNQVRETIRGIMDSAKALLPLLLDMAKQLGGVLLNALKALLPYLMQLLKQLIPPLVQFIRRLIPMLLEIGQRVVPLIAEVIMRLIPFLMSIVERILPLVLGLIERLLPVILRIAEDVLPAIFNIISALLPLMFQIIEAILPLALSLVDALIPLILQFVDMLLPMIITLIETILPLVFQIVDVVLPIIIALLEAVLPILIEIITAVLPVIIELISAILPLVFQIIDAILPVVLELITAILPVLMPIVELVASLVRALLPPIISLLNSILPILQPILAILGPIADILGVIIGAIGKVVEWISGGVGAVVDFIGGLFGGGGRNSGGSPAPAFASGTDRTPDTFIAGEEGPELVTGAAGRKVFTTAETGNIFQTLKDMFSLGGTPRAETVSGVSTSMENKTVIQNNEFTNQFYGERAAQEKLSQSSDRTAGDATGLLSRGLAYVR